MKIVRFHYQDQIYVGKIEGDFITTLDERRPLPRALTLKKVVLFAPCVPSKVVAVGLNYHDHAEEMGHPVPEEPLLFLKPGSSVIGPNAPIFLPPQSARVDYEAELAVVIARVTTKISAEQAPEHILGYTCLNDVTARDLQAKDKQWTRAKGFDTFCPIGPWIETELQPDNLSIELLLNGDVKQKSSTSNLIFSVNTLVEFISHVMTLYPGDVIATGTTSGIGAMKAGDSVEVRIEGIGSLVNPVKAG